MLHPSQRTVIRKSPAKVEAGIDDPDYNIRLVRSADYADLQRFRVSLSPENPRQSAKICGQRKRRLLALALGEFRLKARHRKQRQNVEVAVVVVNNDGGRIWRERNVVSMRHEVFPAVGHP